MTSPGARSGKAKQCRTSSNGLLMLTIKESSDRISVPVAVNRNIAGPTRFYTRLLSISSASVSRRSDAAARKMQASETLASLVNRVVERYEQDIKRES
ncbi:hypothetical protein BH20ACI2_BH20ACI2_27310 [soil metagenome]